MGRRFPDRLIPFATVNPTRENACDMLKRCVEDYGCVGMKRHPDVAGFILSDKKYYEFLQLMDDYKYRDPPKSRYVCTPGLLRAQFATEGPVPRHAPLNPASHISAEWVVLLAFLAHERVAQKGDCSIR